MMGFPLSRSSELVVATLEWTGISVYCTTRTKPEIRCGSLRISSEVKFWQMMRRTPKLKLKLKLVRRQHDATFVDRRKAYACFKSILLLLQGSPLLCDLGLEESMK